MGWSEDLLAEQEEARRKERISASANMNYDPDFAARVFRASAKTNLPSSLVAGDLDNIEAQLDKESFDIGQYSDEVNGSPVFNRFAAENPYNYAVLERNRKNLTRLERTLQPMFQGWDSGWGMTEMAEIRDRHMRGDRRDGDEQRLKELRQLTSGAGDYFGVDSWYAKMMVMTAQQIPIQSWILGESIDEAAGGMATGAAIGGMYGAAGGSFAMPGAGTAIGGAGGAAGGALWGGSIGLIAGRYDASRKLEAGLAYDQYMEAGFDEAESRKIAKYVGIVNGAAESIGLGALTKRLPGFRRIQSNVTDRVVGQLFSRPTFKHGLARATLQYGEGMATELVTEVIQEATTIAGQEYLKSQARAQGDMRPETVPMSREEFWDSMMHIAEATMYGTMLIGAAGPVVQMRADAYAANQAKQQQQYLQTLGETAQDEKLREDAPEAWRALLKRLGADGPVQEFRVRREGWRSYWQGKEIDPDEAGAELGLNDEQLNGDPQDIVIPFEKFVDKVAPTEHFAALLPDMRTNDEAFTQRDAEKWFSSSEDQISRVQNELKDRYGVEVKDEIVSEVKDVLMQDFNYSPKAADVQARLYSTVMTNFAMKSNMDPMELHKMRLKGIKKDIPTSMQKGTTDIKMDPMLDAIRNQNYPLQREIFGDSLIDMIKGSGRIQDQGGELASRDFGSHFPGTMSASGMTHDAAAEIAFEKGYIPEHDVGMLYEAIDRELAGTPVYSRTAEVNEQLNELRQYMEQAASFLEAEGIDIQNMSNEEVRKAIDGIKTFEQSDLEAYTLLLGKAMEEDPSLLPQVWKEMPRVREDQDFRSVTFTDKFETISGKTGTVEINAQDAYDEAVNDRNVLKKLLDCING